jgi:hypothetical protein
MSDTQQEKAKENFIALLQIYWPVLLGWFIIATSNPSPSVDRFGYFVMGFSGFIMIIRRESPTYRKIIRGKWAVIQGIVLLILLWGGLY